MPQEIEEGFLTDAVRHSRRGKGHYKPSKVTRKLSEAELSQLTFFLLDVFLFVAGTDQEIDEKERRVLDRQLHTVTTYPEGLHRDLMWLLGTVRDAQAPDTGDWLASLERTGQALRGLPQESALSGVPRTTPSPVQPGGSDQEAELRLSADLLKGLVEARSSGAILMPGGDIVFEPASFATAKVLLRKLLAEDDYKFFMDRLLTSAVDVITDCWTLGKESITLEDNAILGAICQTFEIDMEGMQDRAERRARG